MKKAILHGPRDLRIEDVPLDTSNLGPHDIWAQTEISALKIGTDRGNYEGAEKVPEAPHYPRGVGDSNLGIVRGVGSQVTRFEVGDRVASKEEHQSEWVADESRPIVKVPDEVSSEDAVWSHLYTLSGLCYWKANFQPGENVAVGGVGVLGLGAIALGPLMGARVVAVANSEIRLEMAEKMGAHAGFLSSAPDLQAKLDEFTRGAGIDLVILTANPWPAYRTSMEIVRPNGRVSVVSLLGRGEGALDFNPLPMEWFYSIRTVHHRREPGRGVPIPQRHGEPLRLEPQLRVRPVVDGGRRPKAQQAHHPPPALHRDAEGVRDGLPPREEHAGRHLRLEGLIRFETHGSYPAQAHNGRCRRWRTRRIEYVFPPGRKRG